MKLVIDTQNMKRGMGVVPALNAAKKLMDAEENRMGVKLPDAVRKEFEDSLYEKLLYLNLGKKPGAINRLFFGARRVITLEADLHPNFGDFYVELVAVPGWSVDDMVIHKALPELHTIVRR